MKTAIIIFVLIAIALAAWGKYASDHDSNPDNVEGTLALIPAAISFLIAVALTVGWGLYRLFTS